MEFAVAYIGMMAVAAYTLRNNRYLTTSLPNLLTILGVLGTFIGICVGLYNFDVTDIQGSIPDLLDGLRFAFITSIAGMGGAVALRVWPAITDGQEESEVPREATLETIAYQLQSGFSELCEHTASVERALTGDGETTLLTQMQKLRTSFVDKQDALLSAFKDFAENMAENNSRALIDALTEVMRDFNAKINEQFGENFKQLNEAVGRMLDWQQAYASGVDGMIEQLDRSVASLEHCEQSMAVVTEQSKGFSDVATGLEQSLGELGRRNTELSAHLEALAGLAGQAQSAFPQIEENMRRITEGFADSTDTAVQSLQTQRQQLQQGQADMNEEIRRTASEMNNHMESLIRDNAERLSRQMEALDESLGDELNKALGTLGSQLASLSSKFVEDYNPLTDRLREVVRLADGMK